MGSLASHRRRCMRFARLVETAHGGPRHHTTSPLDPSLAPLVRLCLRMGEYGQLPGPDPRFRADLRAMLVSTARRAWADPSPAAAPALRPPPCPAAVADRAGWVEPRAVPLAGHAPAGGRTRTAVLVGVTAGALALSGVATTGSDPLPGDPHYQVKRFAEQAQLAQAGSDLHRGRLHLEFARNRMWEAVALDSRQLRASVLADMDHTTRVGVRLLTTTAAARADLSALRVIEEFVAAQRARLTELLRSGPGLALDAAYACASLLAAADRRAKELAAALPRRVALAAPDDLGPRVRRC